MLYWFKWLELADLPLGTTGLTDVEERIIIKIYISF